MQARKCNFLRVEKKLKEARIKKKPAKKYKVIPASEMQHFRDIHSEKVGWV